MAEGICKKHLTSIYESDPKLSARWNSQIKKAYFELLDKNPLPDQLVNFIIKLTQTLEKFVENPREIDALPEHPEFSLNYGGYWNEDSDQFKMIVSIYGMFSAYKENENPILYENLRNMLGWIKENITVSKFLAPLYDIYIKKSKELINFQLEHYQEKQKIRLYDVYEKYKDKVPQTDQEDGILTLTKIEEEYGKDFVSNNYIILMHFIERGIFWKRAVEKYYKYYTKIRMEDDCPKIWELQGNYIPFLLRENARRTGKKVTEKDILYEKKYFTLSFKSAIEEAEKRRKQHEEDAKIAEELREKKRKEAERERKKEILRRKLEKMNIKLEE